VLSEATIRATVRNASASGKALVELKDGGGKGEGRLALFVRVASGRMTTEWYAVWWRDGKRKLIKIGAYPTTGLSDARKSFREDYAPDISAGRNPTGPRTRKMRAGVTVEDLFFAYVRHLKSGEQSAWKFAERTLLGAHALAKAEGITRVSRRQTQVECAADALGRSKRAADVKASDIRAHLAKIHQRGAVVMASRARAYMHSAYSWAMKSANTYTSAVGLVDWEIEHNPVGAVPADPEADRAGQRHLSPAEFRAFWNWLESGATKSIAAPMLQLMMCTGQRVTEILALNEPAYDRVEKMLDGSRTKNGMAHAIPLPDRAVTILDGLVADRHGIFFPNAVHPGQAASLATVEKVVRAFVEDAQVPHFTPRDLRRTWKTLAGAAGLSKDVRDRLQNHSRSDVSSRNYDRYDYLVEKRAGMATWETHLDRILAGEPGRCVCGANSDGNEARGT
jgi:integrase